MQFRTSAPTTKADDVEVAIRALVPRSEAQRELRSLALTLMQDWSANRSLLWLQRTARSRRRCWSWLSHGLR